MNTRDITHLYHNIPTVWQCLNVSRILKISRIQIALLVESVVRHNRGLAFVVVRMKRCESLVSLETIDHIKYRTKFLCESIFSLQITI